MPFGFIWPEEWATTSGGFVGLRHLITCRANPEALFSQGTWGAGQLELRQQTKICTGFGDAFPPTPQQEI